MNIAQQAYDLGLTESEYREILGLFGPAAEKDLKAIKNAFAARDAAAVARAAHSLKGASANLGLSDIANDAREIEEMGRDGALTGAGDSIRSLETHLAEFDRFLANEAIPMTDRGTATRRR